VMSDSLTNPSRGAAVEAVVHLHARAGDIAAALELARRQGATLFELRAALDDFELRGEPARAALADAASRIPTDSALPELARAETAPTSSNPQLG
jgi:hypothetical protein